MTLLTRLHGNHILYQCWDNVLPVDPIDIIQKLGIEVRKCFQINENGINYSGKFTIENSNKKVIYFSGEDTELVQRFSLAHSLYHALTSKKSTLDTLENYSLKNSSELEVPANIFALELLIPCFTYYDIISNIEKYDSFLAKRVEEIQMLEDKKNDCLTINNRLSKYSRNEILVKKSNLAKLARIYNVSCNHMAFRLEMIGAEYGY